MTTKMEKETKKEEEEKDMIVPKRYIYSPIDMEEFKKSSARRELLSFATAMGRSCTPSPSSSSFTYTYNPSNPLVHVSPGIASLHGSLRAITTTWLKEIPPDRNAKARFGNPAFRLWHARLVERSDGIIRCILDCHRLYGQSEQDGDGGGGQLNYAESVLRQCSEAGYAAATGTSGEVAGSTRKKEDDAVVTELREYLHSSFGHPTRLDYGTGHESSFLVFLLCLCKIGCFGRSSTSSSSSTTRTAAASPTPAILAPVTLSIFSQYLLVTRGIQTDYMLEPAGSHGVWGLDDYHCLPFYFGACQLIHSTDDDELSSPSCIHNTSLLSSPKENVYMYLGCIAYIKSLKKGVPFFESSPMLDDISHIKSWSKVSTGLLRLYEGEVLDKIPVVQHFVFGNIFKATWKPSQKPREAPTRTFINGPNGDECVAPWAQNNSGGRDIRGGGVAAAPGSGGAGAGGMPPPTRAPWAK
eukprot:CAMPEP_0185728202 /NCGR_PEP_ID=MMETSP1171-20130828/3634_1 /TAXON_ID=374046 /ORGANISM="Helicotheca tamensis, Strain CCMP826" /LENGTH=468 /DNA_ID=CAMNT_0028396881 /DNA_START=52 /DNA_END=1458 /DNA_ORIENTATION=+